MAKKVLGRGMDAFYIPLKLKVKEQPEKKDNADNKKNPAEKSIKSAETVREPVIDTEEQTVKAEKTVPDLSYKAEKNPVSAKKDNEGVTVVYPAETDIPAYENKPETQYENQTIVPEEKSVVGKQTGKDVSEKMQPLSAAVESVGVITANINTESVEPKVTADGENVIKIPLDRIRPNMYQPRRKFDETALQELAESIKTSGLLQPITVWKDSDRDYYEIIAGERRTRAAKLAGLKEIDAIVRENLSDEKKLEFALIENIQREDLNAIDTAMAYQQLINHFGISQAEISRTVGKSRAAVSNTLRLMELDENIRNAVRSGLISEGHARALLSIPDKARRQEVFQRIVAENLSVREVEAIAQNYHYELPQNAQVQDNPHRGKAPEIINMQTVLSQHFGSKVEIRPGSNGKKGKIVISYYSLDDFERITSILQK